MRAARCAAVLSLGWSAACASPEPRADSARGDTATARTDGGTRVDLTGAGATFPYPLYARWFNEYAQQTRVVVNYRSVGSGEGIRQLLAGTIDFGATDAPMTDKVLAAARHPIVHIPTMLGAVAITYNLPELTRPLRLSGDVLAGIFEGRITRWNDARLAALNPGVTLPARDIEVVHRADASGTTFIFSEYLAAVSSSWREGPGRGTQLMWPTGVGGTGNEGVAGRIKQTEGAIGYLEVVYARQNRLPVAHLRNQAGRFISPMPFEIASAAAAAMRESDNALDLRQSLVNAPGDQSYPIVSFTWLVLAPQQLSPVKFRQLRDLIRWALVDGSDVVGSLGYVALPTVTATRVLNLLDTLAPPDRRH